MKKINSVFHLTYHTILKIMLALLLSAGFFRAYAGTGIYWSFINNSGHDIVLKPFVTFNNPTCWEIPDLREGSVVPAGNTSTYYLEPHCTDIELNISIIGGDYTGSHIKLTVSGDGNALNYPALTNNNISKAYASGNYFGIGTSSRNITTSIINSGKGWYGTILAGVVFSDNNVPLPSGSYTDRCAMEANNDGVLTGLCYDNTGGVKYSTFQYNHLCNTGTSISNINGILKCDSYQTTLPPGSYRDSCVLQDYSNGVLTTSCDNGVGVFVNSTFRYQDLCASGALVWNNNGSLTCKISSMPEGSYLSLCSGVEYKNGIVTAKRCGVGDMISFNLALDYDAKCKQGSKVSFIPKYSHQGELSCSDPM